MTAVDLARLRSVADACVSLRELFAAEPSRADRLTVSHGGIHADFSRQLWSDELVDLLVEHAGACEVEEKLRAMFAGDAINTTEHRAVLHVATRDPTGSSAEAMAARTQLTHAFELADAVRAGTMVSGTGSRFSAVVNIGIGGSDLGPAMVARALRLYQDGPELRFVSNVDPADLDSALVGLDPSTTLFVVSSKTFTTLETMHNAERARRWVRSVTDDWDAHFVAVTANPAAATGWGVREERVLRFFDWVGGRFSVSSTIGFPVMCGIGPAAFGEFLSGMADMDAHVTTAEPRRNLPMMHALVWWANTVLHGYSSVAVVPYSHDLSRLPAYLQQLVMESNGKSVTVDGRAVEGPTSAVVWGEPGTNGQHAFFQMLHQGTSVVPVDFIGVLRHGGTDQAAHDLLVANLLAQSEALAVGRSADEVVAAGEPATMVPHKVFSGNRPSSVIMLRALAPRELGGLVAMYEHSTAIQGWLMGINSFDQWGVELGKTIAASVAAEIAGGPAGALSLTRPLLDWYLRHRVGD